MVEEIHAKSILIKRKRIDSWFMTHYGMNLYRGCRHNCVYCDGRAETYQVQGDFGSDIVVKTNAIDILKRELDPARRRKSLPRSFMMIGGGVCDAYQPAEIDYQLTRNTLELIHTHGYPVHILTKSTLVERDMDLLEMINRKSRAVVSFSFSSTDHDISSIFEPGVPSPSERLAAIRKLKDSGIYCGMFLMPVIPFITDTRDLIQESVQRGREAGIDFVIFGNMTLKTGRQREFFLRTLRDHYADLEKRFEEIFPIGSRWGEAREDYVSSVHRSFDEAASSCGIPKRMPPHVYGDMVSENDRIIVVLEHLDYLLKLKHAKSSYGYAAYSLSKLGKPVCELSPGELQDVGGVGPATISVIQVTICGLVMAALFKPAK